VILDHNAIYLCSSHPSSGVIFSSSASSNN